MKDANGSSRGFRFVNFQNPDDAAAAVENLNGIAQSIRKFWMTQLIIRSYKNCSLNMKPLLPLGYVAIDQFLILQSVYSSILTSHSSLHVRLRWMIKGEAKLWLCFIFNSCKASKAVLNWYWCWSCWFSMLPGPLDYPQQCHQMYLHSLHDPIGWLHISIYFGQGPSGAFPPHSPAYSFQPQMVPGIRSGITHNFLMPYHLIHGQSNPGGVGEPQQIQDHGDPQQIQHEMVQKNMNQSGIRFLRNAENVMNSSPVDPQ